MTLNTIIDHTLLKNIATEADIKTLCLEAKKYDFASVCISPIWVKTAADLLMGTTVKVCTVIGFPHGTTTTATKAFETADAIGNGAEEVDMVIALGKLKEGDFPYVEQDIRAVVRAADGKALVKVIIETCDLTEVEKIKACELARNAGADFVKTSTGFSGGGATEADVRLMRETVGNSMGVKASGGIRSKDTAEKMVAAGASRLGTSCSLDIVSKGCIALRCI